MKFAAFCVATNEVTTDLEKIRPSELGSMSDQMGLGTVQSLTGYFE
jgi:hypothetical protein